MRLVIIIEIQKRKWEDLKNELTINYKILPLNHKEKESLKGMTIVTVKHLIVLMMIHTIEKLKHMVRVMINTTARWLMMMELLQQKGNQMMIPRIYRFFFSWRWHVMITWHHMVIMSCDVSVCLSVCCWLVHCEFSIVMLLADCTSW